MSRVHSVLQIRNSLLICNNDSLKHRQHSTRPAERLSCRCAGRATPIRQNHIGALTRRTISRPRTGARPPARRSRVGNGYQRTRPRRPGRSAGMARYISTAARCHRQQPETQRSVPVATHAQEWNASQIGKSLGLSYHMVNNYVDYIEGALLVRRLPPYSANIRKQAIKRPKLYWPIPAFSMPC